MIRWLFNKVIEKIKALGKRMFNKKVAPVVPNTAPATLALSDQEEPPILRLPNEMLVHITTQISAFGIQDQALSLAALAQTCQRFADIVPKTKNNLTSIFAPIQLQPNFLAKNANEKEELMQKAKRYINRIMPSSDLKSIGELKAYLADKNIQPTKHSDRLSAIIKSLKADADREHINNGQKEYVLRHLIVWMKAYKDAFTEDYINFLSEQTRKSTTSSFNTYSTRAIGSTSRSSSSYSSRNNVEHCISLRRFIGVG